MNIFNSYYESPTDLSHVQRLFIRDEYDFFSFIGNSPKMHFEVLAASKRKKYFTQQADLIKLVTSSVSDFPFLFHEEKIDSTFALKISEFEKYLS